MAKTISTQLADFIHDLTVEELPLDAIEMAKLCVLDWLGSVIAGGNTPAIRAFVRVAKGLGGNAQATVIPEGFKTSSHLAALVNAASSHVMEMDDLHKPSVLHPAAPVIPAALAVAERDGLSGPELIAGIATGYEVAIRAGEALGPTHYRFWHTTGTCGVFGAAAAAGKLLRLTPEQMVWALGSAGTQAAGLWEFLTEGAMSKQLHPAKAAADGLLAALLAQQGFTGASRIFEGEKGLGRATSAAPEFGRLTEDLGTAPLRILENSFKAHAACYHIHSTIDAALALRSRYNLKPAEIRRISVRLYSAAMDLLERVEPVSPYAAKFNIPYCTASALLQGRVGPDEFHEERIRDAAARQLMAKVVLSRDPSLDLTYPDTWPAIVSIETATGAHHEIRVNYPKGDPKNPMTPEELIDKFHVLTNRIIPESSRSVLIERCLTLEKLDSVRCLFDRIDPNPARS